MVKCDNGGAGVARSWGEKFALIVGVKELDALGPLPFSIAAGCVQLGSVALIANGVSFSTNDDDFSLENPF